jgi:hypothetical protein
MDTMKYDQIIKIGSFDCPEIRFEKNSKLSISGRSISLRPESSYGPLISWIEAYQGDNLKIDIDLDIVNCSSVKMLLKALVTANENNHIKQRYIKWYYNDEEQEELGEMISSVANCSRFELTDKSISI